MRHLCSLRGEKSKACMGLWKSNLDVAEPAAALTLRRRAHILAGSHDGTHAYSTLTLCSQSREQQQQGLCAGHGLNPGLAWRAEAE